MSQYLNLKPVELKNLSAKARATINFTGRLVLPKYDGCFAMFLYKDGQFVTALSRDGKPVRSMQHIADDLPRRYPWIVEDAAMGNCAILGEAWSPGREFSELSGMFRRHANQPDLGFAPFDVTDWGGSPEEPQLFNPLPYSERLSYLGAEYAKPGPFLIHTPVVWTASDGDEIERYARRLKATGGYDGAISSDPNAPYVVSNGSKGEFIKHKPLQSFSLECVGYEEATGEKTGRATCALIVRFKGGTCKVGTGLTEEQQANPGQFVGKIIEVACMAVYPGEFGMMREPRFLGIRDDVTQADY
jgi:ATP-dependent DNA ligase